MNWRVLEGEIGPLQTIFTEKLTEDFSAAETEARENGYRLVGRHLRLNAYLLKGQDDFLVLSGRNPESGPAVRGIVVDEPEAALEKGWQDDRFEVFTSGTVGPLRLHLPGLRFKTDGQFVYLVAKGGEGHFFAVDFEPVTEL